MPARKPRRLNGSAANVVNALAMMPASTTRMSAAVSNGTIGNTRAPPAPQAMASRVTVIRTPVRIDRSVCPPRPATNSQAPRSAAVTSTAPAQPISREWGAAGQARAKMTTMRTGWTQTPSLLSRTSRA